MFYKNVRKEIKVGTIVIIAYFASLALRAGAAGGDVAPPHGGGRGAIKAFFQAYFSHGILKIFHNCFEHIKSL